MNKKGTNDTTALIESHQVLAEVASTPWRAGEGGGPETMVGPGVALVREMLIRIMIRALTGGRGIAVWHSEGWLSAKGVVGFLCQSDRQCKLQRGEGAGTGLTGFKIFVFLGSFW